MQELRQDNAELRAKVADLEDALFRIDRWAQNVTGLSADQVAAQVRRMCADAMKEAK